MTKPAFVAVPFSKEEKKWKIEISYFLKNYKDLSIVDKYNLNSIIFDVCFSAYQNIMEDYFVRGRHENISSIYLSKCYSLIDWNIIRNNLNTTVIVNK